jgi:hypothetical protein
VVSKFIICPSPKELGPDAIHITVYPIFEKIKAHTVKRNRGQARIGENLSTPRSKHFPFPRV